MMGRWAGSCGGGYYESGNICDLERVQTGDNMLTRIPAQVTVLGQTLDFVRRISLKARAAGYEGALEALVYLAGRDGNDTAVI